MLGLQHAHRLQQQPRGKRGPRLAEIAAGEAEADPAAQLGQPRDDPVDRLAHAIARGPEGRIDALALGVEEHRVLHERGEHAALPEAEHVGVRAPAIARLRQHGDVEVSGARAIGADR